MARIHEVLHQRWVRKQQDDKRRAEAQFAAYTQLRDDHVPQYSLDEVRRNAEFREIIILPAAETSSEK